MNTIVNHFTEVDIAEVTKGFPCFDDYAEKATMAINGDIDCLCENRIQTYMKHG